MSIAAVVCRSFGPGAGGFLATRGYSIRPSLIRYLVTRGYSFGVS